MLLMNRLARFAGYRGPSIFRRPIHLLLDRATPIEEERQQSYNPGEFYPAHIGQTFQSRYQIVGKLGYGTYSTVWLCRDLEKRTHAALKISTYVQGFHEKYRQEFLAYSHLSQLESSHPGQSYIREVYDSFEISGQHGHHQCLVQPLMHLSALEMMRLNPKPFGSLLLKLFLRRLLSALDFLHSEAKVIHADIKTDNLMLTIEDESMIEAFENAERKDPSSRKVVDINRTIYRSRGFNKPKNGCWGLPILCDFGEARIGDIQNTGPCVQPAIYRAPEVIFEMAWGPPVDIWNVGALIWDLFEGRHLFNHLEDEDGDHDPFRHMAQIVGFLGPPPKEFVSRSETALQCFDPEGHWIAGAHVKVPQTSLEEVETQLEGRDKELFLQFIRSMLQWLPEKRMTAGELLNDPWLRSDS